jgi:hypothetical protein
MIVEIARQVANRIRWEKRFNRQKWLMMNDADARPPHTDVCSPPLPVLRSYGFIFARCIETSEIYEVEFVLVEYKFMDAIFFSITVVNWHGTNTTLAVLSSSGPPTYGRPNILGRSSPTAWS